MFKNNPILYWLTYAAGLQPALTQTTVAEQQCLIKHATGKRKLVEIGVWHGVNTRHFREVMNASGTLYAVDPFPAGRFSTSWQKKIARREGELCRNGSLVWLEQYSNKAIERFMEDDGGLVDFLFIDGDHSYDGVKTDWSLWSRLIAVNGIVALHDSRSYSGRQINHVGAAKFTQDVIVHDTGFRVIDEIDSITVLQRNGE
ncbi:MAG: class I SAM-dependent methyltransferase [Planctomycetaceae bacterium]|nr:class I SAM-dependent methyltransferase [Planctomycetaceae bacterium]MCA9084331.1 class I SAM-dependent methyltransferase [Planctomycetaceae bacterium]